MRSHKGHIRQINIQNFTRQQQPTTPSSKRYTPKNKYFSNNSQQTCIISSSPLFSHKPHNQHNSPHQQLIQQLKHQITELLPFRSSFPNLLFYYQGIKTQYQDLLTHMNETHYMKSHNFLNSQEITLLNQKLRQYEMEYEQMSDYMNLHLVDKLSMANSNNKTYFEKLTHMEKHLISLKEERKSSQLQSQLLKNQQQKLLKELAVSEHISNEKRQLVEMLKLKSQAYSKEEEQNLFHLNQLKTHQSQQHQNQSQLLNQLLQSRKLNNHLINQQKQLTSKLQNAEFLQTQLISQNQSAKDKLINIQTQKYLKTHQYSRLSADSQLLKEQLARLEQLNNIKQQQLKQINQTQIPSIMQQSQVLNQQHLKSTKFLQYLKSYEHELKSTSNVMFQQLNQCCKQDYQKLLKSPKHQPQQIKSVLNTNVPLTSMMKTQNLNHLNSSGIRNSHFTSIVDMSDKKKPIRHTYINELEELDQKENFELQKHLYLMRHQSINS